jgi:hypothetical protein
LSRFLPPKRWAGHGLGLFFLFGLVEQNKGRLLFESEEGRGTTFFVYLPRMVENTPPSLTRKIDPARVKGSETVLLVEDAVMVSANVQPGVAPVWLSRA